MAEVASPRASGTSTRRAPGGLLCVANFPANTGYAWDFIETLYAGVANRLSENGIRTWVAYPELSAAPTVLAGSAAHPIELDTDFDQLRCVAATLRFVREKSIDVVYMADRSSWHPAYLLLRAAGVRRIVVHDHTSGARSRPRGLKRAVKLGVRRALPWMMADSVIGVSDYVARRKVEVDLVPAERVKRLWNSLAASEPNPRAAELLRRELGLPLDVAVIACACRASPPKGVDHLLRAFDRVVQNGSQRAVLVYFGDGPDLDRLRAVKAGLRNQNRVLFAGYRTDARQLIEGADICVVPSVWEEAFGLSALEPMSRGVPVVASNVGGIPEVVLDGETGLLVPPADESAIAAALSDLLRDAERRRVMGEKGRRRALEFFSLEDQVRDLALMLANGFRSDE